MKKLFLVNAYRTTAAWYGVFRVLDNSGRCFGQEIKQASSLQELENLHLCEC